MRKDYYEDFKVFIWRQGPITDGYALERIKVQSYVNLFQKKFSMQMNVFIEDLEKCSNCGNVQLMSNLYNDRSTKNGSNHCVKFCRKYYYIENHNWLKEYQKKNVEQKWDIVEKKRRETGLNFKLAHIIGMRINHAYKARNVEKRNSIFDILGCSSFFFQKSSLHHKYGEMTVELYGSIWHSDYWYPLSKNKLSKGKDVFKSTYWVILRRSSSSENNSKESENNLYFYLLQRSRQNIFKQLVKKDLTEIYNVEIEITPPKTKYESN